MEKRCLDNRNSGFSMVEMLAVVAILIILLGISMVSVAHYRDLLKITELDNAAREIYMAAENRAVLLSGARRLNSQVGKAGTPTKLTGRAGDGEAAGLYCVSKTGVENSGELLTLGSIDPALLDGDFYIVYDLDGGSVTDVFYAESSLSSLIDGGFDAFYADWAKSRSERLKMKDEMLVGWYSGQAAQSGIFQPDPPPDKVKLWVRIKNGEELTVEVGYKGAPGPAELSVKLGNLDLADPNKQDSIYGDRKREEKPDPSGKSYSCIWVLDSLTKEEWKFSELGVSGGFSNGDDFTVTATLTPKDGTSFAPVSASDTNNSLFQEGSSEETAYIGCLRHLQNLDTGFYRSGVQNKTSAVQTDDIRCRGNETYGDYDFVPIYNPKLESYDGRANELRDLYVSGTKFNTHAGLFSRMGTGTSNQPALTVSNVYLINACVSAASGRYAGALMGEAHQGAEFRNCRVYWDTDGGAVGLKDALGSDVDGYRYKDSGIYGKYAGGLVGFMTGSCRISRCLAATLVYGEAEAGGLIGHYDSNDLTIRYSYADCCLSGGESAAGLIGQLPEGKAVELIDCYAAGYVTGGSGAAGLCLGKGKTTAENVYTVVRRIGSGDFSPLTGAPSGDSFTNTYFLEPADWASTDPAPAGTEALTFSEMSDPNQNRMAAIVDRSEKGDDTARSFRWKTGTDGQSYPYNLREGLVLTVYDYPGLKNMPHYGDWTTDFKGTSLVYYEQYEDGFCGVSGGNIYTLDPKKHGSILSDGYAVLCRREDVENKGAVSVDCTWYRDGAEETAGSVYSQQVDKDCYDTDWTNLEGKPVYLRVFPLPESLSNSEYAEDCFYRYLNIAVSAGSGTNAVNMNARAFYNPHFAETAIPIIAKDGSVTAGNVAELAGNLAKGMLEIKIRTPRHLYDLSRFKEYYTRRDVYRQILDLDYARYTGYNGLVQAKGGKPYAQQPIGRYGEAFAGTYNGDFHKIKNVEPDVKEAAERRYAGLFGCSTGTLRNIVYEMDPQNPVVAHLGSVAESLYVGALVGGNDGGIVDNCAVSGANLQAQASGVNLYVGGLVGQNNGTIRNCAAEFAKLSAECYNFARVYIGGLVGENAPSRSVSTSYAVGRIDTAVDATIKTARVCGFVGWNYGSISNSYAAVDLRSSGENVETYGFCGVRAGTQSGTAYLDQGSFAYRGTAYAANYRRDGDRANSVVYVDLANRDKADELGMGVLWTGEKPDPEKEYPYPAAVKDENGNYVHYGQWPEPMPLGEMGIFYWEKLVINGRETYHMSALAVDPVKKTIAKQTNLSQVHSDSGVVTDYGYGYYSQETVKDAVSLSVSNIGYTGYVPYDSRKQLLGLTDMVPGNLKRDENSRSDKREIDAENALSALVDGYVFHCWNTYREAPKRADNNADDYRSKRAVSGLCLFKKTKDGVLDPNSGTFTLSQSGTQGNQTIKVEFIVNPQFADAMSVKDKGGLTVTGGASEEAPGTAGNHYQVRCGMQLQDINWYDTAYTDVPVGLGDYKVYRFPYLNKSYYWDQTHDIDWVKERKSYDIPGEKNDDGVFFPIAQGFARDGDMSLSGWFGGTYDGGSYTLKNFSIGINENNYQINTMGLFGVVKNAALKDIVMFSESGNDVVTVRGRSKDKHDDSTRLKDDAHGWYAGGVLAGVALNSEISNCAVAGYTVRDETTYARYKAGYNSGSWRPQWNPAEFDAGGAVGGLVGMTDGELKGCTAAATIEILCDHSAAADQDGKGMKDAPIRVGGLVGSTTAAVTNCYAGGEIIVSEKADNAKIYVGRIIGGSGVEPFETGADKSRSASVKNCYSYLTLPAAGGIVDTVYQIGGHGGSGRDVPLSNNYYLSGTATAMTDGVQAVTYRQLANLEDIDPGQKIYDKLNAGQPTKPYSPVTSEVGGLAVAGRYSYAPQNRTDLQGVDYPFPTVLTQTRVSDGKKFNVHYGVWTLNGIQREAGGKPVELDMFTQREYTEKLKLSGDFSTDGIWSAEGGDGIIQVSIPEKPGGAENTLTITALKKSDTPAAVTVKYTMDSVEYSLSVTVYVTAVVELRPSTVRIFPNDTVDVELTPHGAVPGSKEYIPIDGGVLSDIKVAPLGQPLAAVTPDDPDAKPAVRLTRTGEEAAEKLMWMDVTYTCTKDGYAEENVSQRIAVTLLDIPEGMWDENGRVWYADFKDYAPTELKAGLPEGALEGFEVKVDGTVVTLKKVDPDAEVTENASLKLTLTMDGLVHELTVAVPPPEKKEEPVP